jgi:5-methyltetrahydrofolate--homocysteine methyltransferase
MSIGELLRGTGIVLLDGANGTQLAARGLDQGGEQNLENPDAVRSIHEAYVRAGSQVVTTNTLTMNRLFLGSHGRGNDVEALNRAGVGLARAAAGELPVLGDMSSTGRLLQPYGDSKEEEFIECFREQASILAEAGVDGFIIETMIDLREALCALKACKLAASLPVFVTLAFATVRDGGRTVMGNKSKDCAAALAGEGADAVGVNCGTIDPMEASEVIARFREKTDLPLIVQPNAGKPRLVNGSAVFDLGPEEFARGLAECVRRGARFVGGCCGTGPAHITAAAKLLKTAG